MVTRRRLRSILNTLALYALAALLIGYFGINAYNGDRGLKAKEDIDRQMATLSTELGRLKAEQAQWGRRIALLKSDALDPDMLDERLHYVPAFVAHSHADYREALVFVLPLELLKPRDLDLARPAISRPEIQQHNLTPVIG